MIWYINEIKILLPIGLGSSKYPKGPYVNNISEPKSRSRYLIILRVKQYESSKSPFPILKGVSKQRKAANNNIKNFIKLGDLFLISWVIFEISIKVL
ncbi:MAG: hypothetical protein U9O87_06860 [Verrucomicrobiota bacterium]|nr:hypothetical protein [Verrucomicrobiota bacterium]